ncbi:hypothetical protein QYM36_001942 [Artemia franciscana]|uniref:Transmembrane protein 208 n=1 Tax=Artemia franciscana TaxID=6661 RepID=A0AA88I8T1_ARTSF|nr:hypothetical protein QYM36_001942 [Artemia franciscana]
MAFQKGKQPTKGQKQIAEENVDTLIRYRNMILGTNVVFFVVHSIFYPRISYGDISLFGMVAAIYICCFQFMRYIARPTFGENGQLFDASVDLNMYSGVGEHVFKKGHSKESLKAATKAQIACDNVRSDIREIQGLRTQMNDPKDAEEFESRINPVKESIEVEMVELAKLIRDVLVVDSQLYLESHSGAKDNVETSNGTLPLSVFEDQTLIHELEAGVERRMDQLEMHQQLERDVQDLEHIMREISRLVHDQRRNVDSVENNISIAQMNVDSGLRNVESAAKMQVAAFPIAGAVIGSCVGGPVGLLVGAKVGGLVAVGGAVVGE